jgi:hypothetical protein
MEDNFIDLLINPANPFGAIIGLTAGGIFALSWFSRR